MSKKGIKATITFLIIAIIAVNVVVAFIFFTNEKSIKSTVNRTKIAWAQQEEILKNAKEQNINGIVKISKEEINVSKVVAPQIVKENDTSKNINVQTSEEISIEKTETTKSSNETENIKTQKETTTRQRSTSTKTEKNTNSTKTETKVENQKETNTNDATNKNIQNKTESESENQVSNTTNQTIATTYKGLPVVGRIEIPKTGVNMPIMSNVTVDGMEIAPCLLISTGELNKKGNTLIVGHNYNNIFTKNKNLKIGDKIYVTTLDGKRVEYTIYNTFRTNPEALDFVLEDSDNTPKIMLSTCTSSDAYRLVVMAK